VEQSPKSGGPESKKPRGRKPYTAPRMTEYGDLRRIALAKGGSKGDGAGKPATKA